MNLLEKIDRTKLIRLKKHLDYIIEHQNEFERFFNRRILSCKRRRNQSKNLCAFFGSLRNQIINEDDDDSDILNDEEHEIIHDENDFDDRDIQLHESKNSGFLEDTPQ
jgi:hypothetical protein